MTQAEFEHEIGRLIRTWPTSFPSERSKVIWVAVKEMHPLWLNRLVTDFIASNKMAPLPTEFIQAVSEQEKKEYLANRRIEYKQKESVFSEEEKKELFDVMRSAAAGKITRAEALQYAEMVEKSLTDRGVQVVHWKEQHKITGDWIR